MKSIGPTSAILFKTGLAALLLLSSPAAGSVISANLAQSETAAQAKQESEFEVKRRDASSKNPLGLSFTIRFANARREFRQGEIIRLEMGFSSSLPKKYEMSVQTWDRSGRLRLDEFYLDPADGFSDPMYDHFNSGLGLMGGGGGGVNALDEKPQLITYDLNEWFRFDRPGKYRLYVASPRVSLIKRDDQTGRVILTSNAVEFEIMPADRAWQEKELKRVIQALDAKDRNADRRSSCRALRFLGSTAAVEEMVRRYGDSDDGCAFEYYAGLIGSPHRDFVIEKMESRLAMPDQPVSNGWLDLLARLVAISRRSEWEQPVSSDERQQRDYWQRRMSFYEQAKAKYAERLARAIPHKTGRTRAISVKTLFGLNWSKWELPEAASIFNDLSPSNQRDLLACCWKRIASPAMLPTLQRIYEEASEKNYDIGELDDLALRRIYELAPEEGRRLIITEMRRPAPRVGRQTLTILPDEMIPELDSIFVDNFEKNDNPDIHSVLIERYGSPTIFSRVMALLDERVGNMDCYYQSRLLAYCLRVDASGSVGLIRRAVTARGKENTRCYPNVFRSVVEFHTSPELEKLAIEFLDDADPEVVVDAATMLGQYGSDGAEEALWRRFEKWHREWNGREEELKVDFHYDNPIRYQTGIEQALRTALSDSPAWLADLKKLERLRSLCVTRNEREQVDQVIQGLNGEIPIRFSPAEDEWGSAYVAHYNLRSLSTLKKKLAQFPKGSVFKWEPFNEGYLDEEKGKLFRELESFLGERGGRFATPGVE
jgi:hypothetical protein